MEVDCSIKSELNETRSAVLVPFKISGIILTLRRAGDMGSSFSKALYLLEILAATESAPRCWILARLFGSAKGWFLDLPEDSCQTPQLSVATHTQPLGTI
jgi:hypothetical protein